MSLQETVREIIQKYGEAVDPQGWESGYYSTPNGVWCLDIDDAVRAIMAIVYEAQAVARREATQR